MFNPNNVKDESAAQAGLESFKKEIQVMINDTQDFYRNLYDHFQKSHHHKQ